MVECSKKFNDAILIIHRKHICTPNEVIFIAYCYFKNVQSHNTHIFFFLGSVTTVLHLKTRWFQLLS